MKYFQNISFVEESDKNWDNLAYRIAKGVKKGIVSIRGKLR